MRTRASLRGIMLLSSIIYLSKAHINDSSRCEYVAVHMLSICETMNKQTNE